jgi:hypothetical protein
MGATLPLILELPPVSDGFFEQKIMLKIIVMA